MAGKSKKSRPRFVGLAEIERFNASWQKRGKGNDPQDFENGVGRSAGRLPNPEHRLNFNDEKN